MKVTLPTHAKTYALADELETTTGEAVGILVILWNYCKQYARDGDLSRLTPTHLARIVGRGPKDGRVLLAALHKTGWIDPHPHIEGAFIIHHWLEHCEGYIVRHLAQEGRLDEKAPRKTPPSRLYNAEHCPALPSTAEHCETLPSTAKQCSLLLSPSPSLSLSLLPAPSSEDADAGEEPGEQAGRQVGEVIDAVVRWSGGSMPRSRAVPVASDLSRIVDENPVVPGDGEPPEPHSVVLALIATMQAQPNAPPPSERARVRQYAVSVMTRCSAAGQMPGEFDPIPRRQPTTDFEKSRRSLHDFASTLTTEDA